MKTLDEMNFEEFGKLFPILLMEYQSEWREIYIREEKLLLNTTGNFIQRIRHFGSTSIPFMIAKPTIDILIEVQNEFNKEKFIENLRSIGYEYTDKPENPPPHMMFMKGYTPKGFRGQAFHIHVRFIGDWDEILFRDYLLLHPETASEYGELKIRLKEKYEYDREAYTAGKSQFVQTVTKKARQELGKKA